MKRIFNGSGGRKAALILSLCLIFALAVGTTLALLTANTDPVTNTFTAAKSKITIEEKTDNGSKSEIYVKNEGTATSYVRVKLVCNWVDKDGNVSATPVPAPTITNSDWFEKDGIYYYTKAPEGCRLEVTVLAESIQAAPSKAVTDSWGVRVDNNGYLTQPTTTP